MNKKPNWIILISIMLGLVIIGYWGKLYFYDQAKDAKPVYGVVEIDEVMKHHSLYVKYKMAETELANLKAQYTAQQNVLQKMATDEQKALEQLNGDGKLDEALEREYQAKMALKQEQLNSQLLQAYNAYLKKYANELPDGGTANLKIVNLQLALNSLSFENMQNDKETKEKELQELLDKADPDLVNRNPELAAKLESKMKSLRQQAEADLQAYSAELKKELWQKGEARLKLKADAIKLVYNLPNPDIWQEQWNEKIRLKEAEVKKYHEAILQDIRSRVEVIAQNEGLSLVLTKYYLQDKVLDITSKVIASYK